MGCPLCVVARVGVPLAVVVLMALVAAGVVRAPLPSPAFGKFAEPLPAGAAGLDWRPRPLEGALALNSRLRSAARLFDGRVVGAESVAAGPRGQLVMLDRTGALWEAWPSGGDGDSGDSGGDNDSGWRLDDAPRARLGPGRPLGYHFDQHGDLIICDSLKGLTKYEYATNRLVVLASHVSPSSPLDPGTEITYANDLAIASGGSVYFTDSVEIRPALNAAGFYDTYRAWFLGVMQAKPQGRLLRYDPESGETVVLAKGFYYANGVALSRDESFVALAETDALRVHRVYVSGPRAGQRDVLIDRLPGVPDGVDAASAGGFWVSLVGRAPPFTCRLLNLLIRSPLARAVAAWLPPPLRPRLHRWGAVLRVGEGGELLEWLTDADGARVSTVSAVSESRDGARLFLGNLVGAYVSVLPLQRQGEGEGGAGAGEGSASSGGGGHGGEL